MKNRKHKFTISVTFDKPCTVKHALREIRDTIYGENYCTQFNESDPGSYRVKKIARIPRRKESC